MGLPKMTSLLVFTYILWSFIGQAYTALCPPPSTASVLDPFFVCFVNSSLEPQGNPSSRSNQPKLTLVDSRQEIIANDSFNVECIGSKLLNWRISNANIEIGERLSVVESYDANNESYPYSSKLVLTEAQYLDTSYYTCFYKDSELDLPELLSDNAENAVSAYLFVNDEDNLLTDKAVFLVVSPKRQLVIPCRPTNSKTKVTLYKKVGSEEIPVALENDRVAFDPTRGFIISFPDSYYKYFFICRASFGNQVEEEFVILQFKSGSTYAPQPIINTDNASFITLSSSFSLNCIVELHDLAVITNAYIKWEYPAEKQAVSYGRYLESNMTPNKTRNLSNKMHYQRWEKTLHISNAQEIDQGKYTCHVQIGENDNENSVLIEVHHPNTEPYINITSNPISMIIANENETISLVFTFQSSLNDVKAEYFKDGQLIDTGGKRMKVTKTKDSAQLLFPNTNREDSGNYTVKFRSGEIETVKSVLISIKVPPITRIIEPPEFFDVNQQYQLNCVVDGFPNVSIWWEKRRSSLTDDCSWKTIDNETTSINNELVDHVNRTLPYKPLRSLTLDAIESAEYRCNGQNSLGISRDSWKFIVTDVKDGLGIISSPSNPIEGDSVLLSCMGHRLLYDRVSWYYIRHGETEILHTNKTFENNWQLMPKDTPYSLGQNLFFPEIKKNLKVTFKCIGKPRHGRISELPYLLSVQAMSKPKFLSNESSTLWIDLEPSQRVVLNCSTTGVPQPEVVWFKDESRFSPNFSSPVLQHDNTGQIVLITAAIKEIVEGVYVCKVRNRAGEIQKTFRVLVEE